MVTNERQRRLTAAEISRFERAIVDAETTGPGPEVHPKLQRAMVEGMRSQLGDLKNELRAYDDLRAGRVKKRVLRSLGDLADALIEGRIAARLTQRQLADRLGVAEQQVQRYEQTRYRSVNLERLQAIADALQLGVRESIEYHVAAPAHRPAGSRPSRKRTGATVTSSEANKKAASSAGETQRSKATSKAAKTVPSGGATRASGRKGSVKASTKAGRPASAKGTSKTGARAAR